MNTKGIYADARKRARQHQVFELRLLRSIPFEPRTIPPAFEELCATQILPRLNISGYKQDEKRNVVAQCALALVRADCRNMVVADSRTTAHAENRMRANIWDLLRDAGFCLRCLGSECSAKTTRYQATKQLMKLRDVWTQKYLEGPLIGRVRLKWSRPGKKKERKVEIPFDLVIRKYAQRDERGRPERQAVQNFTCITRVVEEAINQINSVNLDHSWKAVNDAGTVYQPVVQLVQTHIQELWRGTRLYTQGGKLGGQSLAKEERARMLIDGEQTAELDFSGSLARLAYHCRGFNVPASVDVYAPHRILWELWPFLEKREQEAARDFVKRATCICLNASNRKDAEGAVHEKRMKYSTPDRIPPAKEVVNRIVRLHHRLESDFFCDKGMKLITVEGQIMLEILKQFVLAAKKPALAIHDALVVRQRDAKLAKFVMEQCYFKRVKHSPVIKQKNH